MGLSPPLLLPQSAASGIEMLLSPMLLDGCSGLFAFWLYLLQLIIWGFTWIPDALPFCSELVHGSPLLKLVIPVLWTGRP